MAKPREQQTPQQVAKEFMTKATKGKKGKKAKKAKKDDQLSPLMQIPLREAILRLAQELAPGPPDCPTRMSVAFMAAEMLLQLGRGQMAAQLGINYSENSGPDLITIMNQVDIFQPPANPNMDSTVEKLFNGFCTSIAYKDAALKKQRWKTAGSSDLIFIGALSFLVGNIAWQRKANPTFMTREEVKAAFEAVKGVHCPTVTPSAGGGPFCDWMDL